LPQQQVSSIDRNGTIDLTSQASQGSWSKSWPKPDDLPRLLEQIEKSGQVRINRAVAIIERYASREKRSSNSSFSKLRTDHGRAINQAKPGGNVL
jgi:hypothetical protein